MLVAATAAAAAAAGARDDGRTPAALSPLAWADGERIAAAAAAAAVDDADEVSGAYKDSLLRIDGDLAAADAVSFLIDGERAAEAAGMLYPPLPAVYAKALLSE